MLNNVRDGSGGFTLLELVMVLLVCGLLATFGSALYREQVTDAQRAGVVTLLQQNALFLESFFSEHGSYKQTPTQWPDLPHGVFPPTGTARYQMAFGSLPRNTDEGYYVLRATSVAQGDGFEVISLTQTGILKSCVTRGGVERCELLQ